MDYSHPTLVNEVQGYGFEKTTTQAFPQALAEMDLHNLAAVPGYLFFRGRATTPTRDDVWARPHHLFGERDRVEDAWGFLGEKGKQYLLHFSNAGSVINDPQYLEKEIQTEPKSLGISIPQSRVKDILEAIASDTPERLIEMRLVNHFASGMYIFRDFADFYDATKTQGLPGSFPAYVVVLDIEQNKGEEQYRPTRVQRSNQGLLIDAGGQYHLDAMLAREPCVDGFGSGYGPIEEINVAHSLQLLSNAGGVEIDSFRGNCVLAGIVPEAIGKNSDRTLASRLQ